MEVFAGAGFARFAGGKAGRSVKSVPDVDEDPL
jgi:hypothetical protein